MQESSESSGSGCLYYSRARAEVHIRPAKLLGVTPEISTPELKTPNPTGSLTGWKAAPALQPMLLN